MKWTLRLAVLLFSVTATAQTGPIRSSLPVHWFQNLTAPPMQVPTFVMAGDSILVTTNCRYEHCELPEFNYTNRKHPGIKFGELTVPIDPHDDDAYQYFLTRAPQTGYMIIYMPTPNGLTEYDAVIEVRGR